jgi:hypothetical protein
MKKLILIGVLAFAACHSISTEKEVGTKDTVLVKADSVKKVIDTLKVK